MEKNDIKKALYKQNPMAHFVRVGKGGIMYTSIIEDSGPQLLTFLIPLGDMGDAIFNDTEDAKLLIRWLQD